ncbi:hypothetical protein [Butyrivibrio sp. INlla14]|uniref:hypothetical protein n=1 Tax=Butyrivibrio sp. INlla14 TaxID=1520808 RepID=UPI000876D8F9|nr:hypothetical protein [Butyrivibrio sp. INlla14]SCY47331.1 hypothetical protein SAMN02910371_02440 [Butyrivibrio sp. INlla14]
MGYECYDTVDSGAGGQKIAISEDEIVAANERMEVVRTDAEKNQNALDKLNDAAALTYEGDSAQSWYSAAKTVWGYLGAIHLTLADTIEEMEKICKNHKETDDAAADRAANMIDNENGEG